MPATSHFLVSRTDDGKLKIDVRFEGETVWLTQQHMAELFQTTKQNVSLHVQNVYDEQELALVATAKESLTVQQEGRHSVKRTLDERLKNPDQPFDYFEDLTRRIQDIRTSERRFYCTASAGT